LPPFTLQVTPLEAGRSSETVMFTDETSRRQKPEDDNLNTHRPETPPLLHTELCVPSSNLGTSELY